MRTDGGVLSLDAILIGLDRRNIGSALVRSACVNMFDNMRYA